MTDTAREPCTWAEQDSGPWETRCGNTFEFVDGSPLDSHFNYCPYCGADIVEELYRREEEDGR